MRLLNLPQTRGCVVCGRDNPIGLKLSSFVDLDTGHVGADFIPDDRHIGFTGVIHGGILATLLDEVMVWCATWAGKRFCLAGELAVRYRTPGRVGTKMRIESRVEIVRSRLITTVGTIHADGVLVAEGSGKYIPLGDGENEKFLLTLVDDPQTREAKDRLLGGCGGD